MSFLLVQHALQGVSGLPEDRYVNTFHLQGTGPPTEPQMVAIKDALVEFYGVTAGPTTIGAYLSGVARGVGRTVKIYDHQAVKPRAPLYEFIDPLAPFPNNGEAAFPNEVAMCISFSAPKLSGAVAARRRGRIYLGPLNGTTSGLVATVEPRPSTAFQTVCLDRFRQLLVAFTAAGHLPMVYSPTIDAGDTGDTGAFSVVTQYWVDDAFDTQRRRGGRALTKTVQQLAG